MGDNSSLSTKYSYTELNCDSVQARQKSGEYSAADWGNFYFTQKEYIVAGIKVVNAQIPFMFDVITSENNVIYFSNPVVPEGPILLPQGTFTGEQLAGGLQIVMSVLPPYDYTVTWNSSTKRIRIFSPSTNFTLRFDNLATGFIYGFPVGTFNSMGGVLSSPNVASVTGPYYLYLNSSVIGPSVNCHAQDDVKGINQICKIPIDVNPEGIINFRDPNPDQFFDFQTSSDFTNFDLYLTLGLPGMEKPINTKGLGFSVTLGIYQYRKGGSLEQPGNITFSRR